MQFTDAINQQLCSINNILQNTLMLKESEHKRDNDIVFITIPEDGGLRAFQTGTTNINLRNGQITNPNGTIEWLQTKLDLYQLLFLHSISVDSNQDIILKLDGKPKRTVYANFSTQIPYLTYSTVEITCTTITNIQLFCCTNPSAVIGQFKVMTVGQDVINADVTEAQTWDIAIISLLSNMNRIRNQIINITGETWGTVSHSISDLWAKFNATTGHTHSGADSGAQVNHTTLSNIGTNTHAQLDTAIGTTLPGLVITHAALTTGVHGAGASTVETVAGTATHAALTNTHGGELQTAAMKNVANGILGLDDSAKVEPGYLRFYEEYANHLGATDPFTQTVVTGNGTATPDNTNHEMDLSSGIDLAGYAAFQTKRAYTLSARALVSNFIYQNLVAGTSTNKQIMIGLKLDFSSLNGLDVAAFVQQFDASWAIMTGNGVNLTNTAIGAPPAGAILSIEATSSGVKYYVNGVLVCTHTAYISTEGLYIGIAVQSQDASAGTARTISLDYFGFKRTV